MAESPAQGRAKKAAEPKEEQFDITPHVLEWKNIEFDKLKIDTDKNHGQVRYKLGMQLSYPLCAAVVIGVYWMDRRMVGCTNKGVHMFHWQFLHNSLRPPLFSCSKCITLRGAYA